MRPFPLLVFLFLFVFLVERATCCLLKPGGTVVVEGIKWAQILTKVFKYKLFYNF